MDYVVSKVLIDLYKNMENNEIFKDETISLDKLLDIVKKYMEKQNPVYCDLYVEHKKQHK